MVSNLTGLPPPPPSLISATASSTFTAGGSDWVSEYTAATVLWVVMEVHRSTSSSSSLHHTILLLSSHLLYQTGSMPGQSNRSTGILTKTGWFCPAHHSAKNRLLMDREHNRLPVEPVELTGSNRFLKHCF